MRRFVLLIAIIIPVTLSGQELVATFTMDTSQYENSPSPYKSFAFISGPDVPYSLTTGYTEFNRGYFRNNGIFLFAYHKKNSNQYDIFSYSGKIGSIIISLGNDSIYNAQTILSQTFIDNDNGWEYIVNYISETFVPFFKLCDENGNILLSDCGEAFFGYDGQNTYVLGICNSGVGVPISFKTWRFRTNVASSFPQGLAKTAGQPNPIMYFGASGDMRVRLQPASGGKTSVQFFDMLGRLTYTKIVDNVTQPASFTIPSNQVPESPFVSKVKNDNGASLQKVFPVH